MLKRPHFTVIPPSLTALVRRSPWPAAAILVCGVAAAYSGGLNAPFVYDDTLAIVENQTIRRLWPLTDVLWPQGEGGLTVSGRPVLNLSLAINYALGGTRVWSYHVFNLLVHAGSTLLLFGIMRRTVAHCHAGLPPRVSVERGLSGGSDEHTPLQLGFAVAAVWSLHPLLTQAVTYTVQRAESLMGLFYLLTLHGFLRGTAVGAGSEPRAPRSSRWWLVVSVAACMLGMGTKEVMATAPLMVFLYDRTFVTGSSRATVRERGGYYLALAATWLVLAALVLSTGGNRGGTVGIGTGIPLWAYPLTQFEAITRYLLLVVWPHPLIFEYGTFWVQHAAELAPYAALVVPLVIGTVVALWRRPILGFCGCWFFLILAPTSLAPGTIQMIVEHRIYLPLVAVAAIAVVGMHRVFGRRAILIATIVALACGVLTYHRNHDYRSRLALWSDTVAKRPHNPRAHDGLAEALTEAGRIEEALAHRREAVRLEPEESKYHYNLAMTLSAANQRDEAIRHYQEALRLAPNEARTHNNLAILLGQTGDHSRALSHYAQAVQLNPDDALYHYNHGVALMRAGRHRDATASFETALQLRHDFADARVNLATALVRDGRVADALLHFTEVLRASPDDPEYRTAFGGALLLARRPAEALVEFQRVLTRHANSVEAMFGMANALAALGRKEEAVVHYEAVLKRSPSHAAAHFKLADALFDLDRVSAAVEHYTQAVSLSPNDAEAHHNLGVSYARLERWAEAERSFETALRLKPDYADARRNLQQLRAVLGR